MPKFHASSIATGALLSLGLLVLLGQASPQSTYASWGPPKQGVINVFNVPGADVPPGGLVVLFQVPPDRWLTITGAWVNGGCVSPGSGEPSLRFAEQLGGVTVEKGWAGYPAAGFSTDSPVGWVFRPGSQVVVTNASPNGCSFSRYGLTGYQTRD